MHPEMKKLSIILILFILALSSCYYMDLNPNNVEVISSYSPTVNITSNLDQVDTIRLIDSLFFSYTIDIDTGKLFFADLYLGSYQLLRSGAVADSFWMYFTNNNPPGEYELILSAYYKTYSGSLADKYNSEFFVADTSWVLNLEPEI